MTARALTPVHYLAVLAILVLLTFVTIGVSFLPLSGAGHIVVGLLIAAVKASLVVLFFMHALTSPRITWNVIAAAVLWTTVLFVLTLCDYFTRGQLPYTPGH